MHLTDTYSFNYPDFIIVGAAKSGTTSLHRYLSQHPDLFLPEIKETWFYHLVDNPNRAILRYFPQLPTTLPAYLSLFEGAREGQQCGEVTPSYLHYYARTIANLQKYHPNWRQVKIIMILREPVEKVLSHYRYVRRHHYDPDQLDLYTALQREPQRRDQHHYLPDLFYVENTRYPSAVGAYLTNFPQVKVILYDDLQADRDAVMRELTAFIGVRPYDYLTDRTYNRSAPHRLPRSAVAARLLAGTERLRSILPGRVNQATKRLLTRIEPVDPRALELLKTTFRPEVAALAPLIGRDLDHWLARYD